MAVRQPGPGRTHLGGPEVLGVDTHDDLAGQLALGHHARLGQARLALPADRQPRARKRPLGKVPACGEAQRSAGLTLT